MTQGTETKPAVLSIGTILVLEHGEYSDFSYDGPFVVLKELDKKALFDEYSAKWKDDDNDEEWRGKPTYRSYKNPDNIGFIPWLVRMGYIEDVATAHRWWIGAYGNLKWSDEPNDFHR